MGQLGIQDRHEHIKYIKTNFNISIKFRFCALDSILFGHPPRKQAFWSENKELELESIDSMAFGKQNTLVFMTLIFDSPSPD